MKGTVFGMAMLGLTMLAPGLEAGLPPDITVDDVQLRPGVLVDIHVKVFLNEVAACGADNGWGLVDRTLFAIHGLAHTAATWEPLVKELFEENPTGRVICQVAAIDLPGRGGSGLPDGLSYGELVLADHVTAILGTLEALSVEGIWPQAIIGHSQGGLLVQMMQQRLLDEGTNLRCQFKIRHAVLLAPALPVEIPWEFVDSGESTERLGQFLTSDPMLGSIISIPDAIFPLVFFSNLNGIVASGAPTSVEVTALGYNAKEPLFATLNSNRDPLFIEPSVHARTFTPRQGTKLHIATYENDQIIRPDESTCLYKHLTGDRHLRRLAVVTGPESVHDLHIANPEGLLQAIAGTVQF